MHSEIVYIIDTQNQILGFESLTANLCIGDISILNRLESQLSKYTRQIKKIHLSKLADLDGQFVFFDDTVYSESFVESVFENEIKFSKNSLIKINQNWNSSFCVYENVKWEDIPYTGKIKEIANDPILYMDLNLPQQIYGTQRYVAAAPKYFYQKISDWPDLLKAQSLCARELSGKTAKPLTAFLSNDQIVKLSDISFLKKFSNKIGKNCKIHPTAIIEGSVIGDNVEIGPFCYIRASIIGSRVTIREHSSIKMSSIGTGSYILPSDILNCYLGQETCITTSILFHTVIGAGTFLGGAVGFADLNANRSKIKMDLNSDKVESDQVFLGSMVAENCFIGAGVLFHSGQRVHHHTTILNQNMIQKSNFKSHQTYIAKLDQIVSIPKHFLQRDV